jgi:hypothetical protein
LTRQKRIRGLTAARTRSPVVKPRSRQGWSMWGGWRCGSPGGPGRSGR